MMSISSYNPEYNAKPWLNTTSNPPLPTAGGQGVPITTLALGVNGQGLPPIHYSLPQDFTGFGENGGGLPPIQTMREPENCGGDFITLAYPENGGVDLPLVTQAIPENGGGTVTTLALGENGSGTPPRYYSIGKHRYSNPTDCHHIASPKKELMFKLWAFMAQFSPNSFSTSKTASVKDPYTMVQNPWMRPSSQSSTNPNFFWQV